MSARGDSNHWADEAASRVLERGRPPVISTGISPSGEIHVGNLREVLTGDAVFRALRDRGAPARFNFVADNLDPLRRVYDFLDRSYERWVGHPLCEIPAPVEGEVSYAEHFLQPFLRSLDRLRIDVEVVRSDELYRSGRMTPCVMTALEHRERIAAILHEETGKPVRADWSPFHLRCPGCGRIDRATVTGFSREDETVAYRCRCGSTGRTAAAGGGKLVWRVDWPARWKVLGVSLEPFGKDHATRGGSYDTGVRLAREIFGIEPPLPLPYEWIRLRGRGDMSSSRGNVLSIARALEVVPPDALRYAVLRERPHRTITFDPGRPLMQLVDEVDDAAASGRDERALQLSRAGGSRPVGVPFKHLVVVAQATGFDVPTALATLARTGYPEVDREALEDRLGYARRWLASYAPEELRFEVREEVPPEAANLGEAQRGFLGALASRLGPGMTGEQIHALVYELAGEFREEVRPAELFQAIYVAILGKPRGPRAGAFLAVLGAEFCARRFREAASLAGPRPG